jgi:50S ribosomal subunit-associated GTPase HflX
MSFGGGSGSTGSELLRYQLEQDRYRANVEAGKLRAETERKDAEIETKRVNRLKGGGMQAFTTAGYTGYPADRQLGGGNSLAAVSI